MIACPQCQHANPDGATHCEACFYELPTLVACPHCSASVQSDATFCGQCGNAIATGETVQTAPKEVPSSELITAPLEPSIASSTVAPAPVVPTVPASRSASTQLQREQASLFHVQTQVTLELPTTLALIHLGKPNDRIPPDIDLSGFPDSDVVSRIHADIRVEGDQYYLEDVGSANGTYVNHTPLTQGNRHRLRAGDRISFGKGDLVSLIFQLA